MRFKVAALIVLMGVLALGGIWCLRELVKPGPSVPGPTAVVAPTDPGSTGPQVEAKATPSATSPSPETAPLPAPGAVPPGQGPDRSVGRQTQDSAASAEHQAHVRSRVMTLRDLAMEDDPASLQTILAELTNADRAIRVAALEATVQFGSRDAIPRLKEAAAATDDPKEKVALVEAAEFLELPSLTEVRAQMKQRKAKQTGDPGTQPQTAPKSPPP
jgi:hypothetical protein